MFTPVASSDPIVGLSVSLQNVWVGVVTTGGETDLTVTVRWAASPGLLSQTSSPVTVT